MAPVLGRGGAAAGSNNPTPPRKAAPAIHLTDLNVLQGESKVSNQENTCLTTILGSCIAVCIYDGTAGVAGMNHFLLPVVGEGQKEGLNPRSGIHVMELLINGMLKLGATKAQMTARVLGGAMMLGSSRNIGSKNADFALKTLANEGIPVIDQHLGGVRARRLRFEVASGGLHMQLLKPAPSLVQAEQHIKEPKFDTGSVDLF